MPAKTIAQLIPGFSFSGGTYSIPVSSLNAYLTTAMSTTVDSGAELFRTLRSCEHAAAGRRALANTVHVGAATWADIGHGGGSSAAVAGVDSSSSFYASPAARFTTTQMERHGPLIKVTNTCMYSYKYSRVFMYTLDMNTCAHEYITKRGTATVYSVVVQYSLQTLLDIATVCMCQYRGVGDACFH